MEGIFGEQKEITLKELLKEHGVTYNEWLEGNPNFIF